MNWLIFLLFFILHQCLALSLNWSLPQDFGLSINKSILFSFQVDKKNYSCKIADSNCFLHNILVLASSTNFHAQKYNYHLTGICLNRRIKTFRIKLTFDSFVIRGHFNLILDGLHVLVLFWYGVFILSYKKWVRYEGRNIMLSTC